MTPTSSVSPTSHASDTPRELVLHAYWRSSASYRVRLALAAKCLPHRVVPVNILAAEQNAESHLGRSPTGYVPALLVDGVAFFESVAIIELLDELYPDPPLFPADPFARCRVRALVEVINAGIQPLQNLNVTKRLDAAMRDEWVRHYILKGLTAFERAMGANVAAGVAGDFSFGASLTVADLVLVPQLASARRFHVDLTPFTRILRAEATTLAVAGLEAAAPDKQPDAVVTG